MFVKFGIEGNMLIYCIKMYCVMKSYINPGTAANVALINEVRTVCWRYLREDNSW